MAIQGAVRARGHRGAELRSLNGGDLEDGKYHGDTLLFGLNISKRAALLVGAALLAVVLVAVSFPGEDDAGGMAEKRLGGAPRGEDLLTEEAVAREEAGFARPTLPHSTKSKSAKAGSKSALSSHKSKTASKKKTSAHKAPSSSAAGGPPAPLDPSEREGAMDGEEEDYPNEQGLGVGGGSGSGVKKVKKSGSGTATGSAKKAYKVAGKLKSALDEDDDEDVDDEDLDDEDSDAEDDEDSDIDDEDEDDEDEDDDDIVDHVDEEDERSDEELKKYANAMYDEMDKNKDDKVSWEEYYHVVKKDKDYTGETKAEEEEDFREIDKDKDGFVTRQELVDDWLREDLDFADDDELDDDDDEDEDDMDEDEDDADVDDDDDEDRPVKKVASKSSKAAASSKTKSSDDETLGDKLKDTALKIFKTRAPTAKSINVKLYQAGGVSWSQADQHCAKLGKRLCPERAVQQLKLCRDPDPSHKGRSVPIDSPGLWVVLDTCAKESHGADRANRALIACC